MNRNQAISLVRKMRKTRTPAVEIKEALDKKGFVSLRTKKPMTIAGVYTLIRAARETEEPKRFWSAVRRGKKSPAKKARRK